MANIPFFTNKTENPINPKTIKSPQKENTSQEGKGLAGSIVVERQQVTKRGLCTLV